MDYEKKYNEALAWMRELYPGLHGATKEDAEHFFPELCESESEDEMIRKGIIEIIKAVSGPDCDVYLDEKKQEKYLAWLEKQKESLHIPETCKENADSFTSEQKEQKPETLTDGTKEYTIREDYTSAYYEERGYARGYNDGIRYSKLVSSKPPQKAAEKQDYSGLNDLERAILRGFLAAGIENVPATIIKETAQEYLAQMRPADDNPLDDPRFTEGFDAGRSVQKIFDEPKPAEWSEEDERRIDAICELLENTSAIHPNYSRRKLIIWLKSLRPSWKARENEERLINTSISFLKDFADKGYENAVECIDWLKSKL